MGGDIILFHGLVGGVNEEQQHRHILIIVLLVGFHGDDTQIGVDG